MRTMEEIKQKRLEILEWEKANRNSKNRSSVIVDDDSFPKCIYSGEIGCAVGRLITDKLVCEEMDSSEETIVNCENIQSLLPLEIKELGICFLSQIQLLHDESVNWNDSGLSVVGMKKWESIKAVYC